MRLGEGRVRVRGGTLWVQGGLGLLGRLVRAVTPSGVTCCPIAGTVPAVLGVGVAAVVVVDSAVGGRAAAPGPGRWRASRGSARATIGVAGPGGRGRPGR